MGALPMHLLVLYLRTRLRSKASESLARVQVIAAMTALEALMLWNTPTRCLLDWPQRSGFQQVLSLATILASSFSSSPRQLLQLPSALRCLMLELALMSWRLILLQQGDLQMDSWYEMPWIRTELMAECLESHCQPYGGRYQLTNSEDSCSETTFLVRQASS